MAETDTAQVNQSVTRWEVVISALNLHKTRNRESELGRGCGHSALGSEEAFLRR